MRIQALATSIWKRPHAKPLIQHVAHIAIMWIMLLIYLWPLGFGGTITPYNILYSMEPWYSELGQVWSTDLSSSVVNVESNDAIYTMLPIAEVTKRQLWSGDLPLWDANTLTGFGLAAFSPLYPVQLLIYALFPVGMVLGVTVIFHLFLMSLFGYLTVTSLDGHPLGGIVTGLAVTVNGLVMYYLIAPGMLIAIAWVLGPFWCFLEFQRRQTWRWALVGGLCYGMIGLTANPQLVLYTAISLGALVLFEMIAAWIEHRRSAAWRYLGFGFTVAVVGILIGLPSLFALYILAGTTARPPMVFQFTNAAAWIRVIVADYWGSSAVNNLTPGYGGNTRLYIGVVPIMLALLVPMVARKRTLITMFLIGLYFVFVTLNLPPFSTLFYAIMPSVYLDHSRTLIVSTMLFSVCAGMGIDVLIRQPRARRVMVDLLLGVLLLLSGLLISLLILPEPTMSEAGPTVAFRVQAVRRAMLLTGAGLAVVLLLMRRWPILAMRLLVLLVAVDLFITFWRYQTIYSADYMRIPPTIQRLAALVHKDPVPARVFSYDPGVFGVKPQVLNIFDIPQITGYTSLPIDRYNRYTFASGARLFPEHTFWLLLMEVSQPRARLLDALGARYMLVSRNEVIAPDTRELLLPEVGRLPFLTSRYPVMVLPEPLQSLPLTIRLPADGRSFLLTGLAVERGTIAYRVLVNGQETQAEKLEGGSTPFWHALGVDLSAYANQTVTVQLEAQPSADALWHWVDPQIQTNPDQSDLRLLSAGGMLIYENLRAFPRAWLVHRVDVVPEGDLETAEIVVKDEAYDLRSRAVIEAAMAPTLGQPNADDRAEITSYQPDTIIVKVHAVEQALLVIPDVYHKIWRVRVDGKEAQIYPTNLTMRGVVVPPGEHTVEMYFNWTPFLVLAMISGVTMLGAAVWIGLGLRRKSAP